MVTYSPGHPANGNVNGGGWTSPQGWLHRKSNLVSVAILFRNGFHANKLASLKIDLRTSIGQAVAINYTDIQFAFGPDANRATFKNAIRTGCKAGPPDFVVFVNPWANDKRPYDTFRCVTDIDMGIPSICITQRKLDSASGARFIGVVSGNALKVNSRFRNGINQRVTFTLPGPANMNNTIILGADVTHPGSSSLGAGSIAAMVGTLDHTGLSYGGSARPNFPRQEVRITIALPFTMKLTACLSGLTALKRCSRNG